MEIMTNQQITTEALDYLTQYDQHCATPNSNPWHERTAYALADFMLESKYADTDPDCNWNDAQCQSYFDTAFNALLNAGLPKGDQE